MKKFKVYPICGADSGKKRSRRSFKDSIVTGKTWNEFIKKFEDASGLKVDEFWKGASPNEVEEFYITAYGYSTGDEVEFEVKVTPTIKKDGTVLDYITFLTTDVKVV